MFKRDQIWAWTLTRLDKSASVLLSREQRVPASATTSDRDGRKFDEVWLNRIKARWYGDTQQTQY